MERKSIQSLIKKIVEEGTSNAYTLLHIQTDNKQMLSIQNIMELIILIKNNACEHKYEILFGDFLQSKKLCEICTSTIITKLSDRQSAIKYSQHNTQLK